MRTVLSRRYYCLGLALALPEPDFFPPPDSLLTVAYAISWAFFSLVPRFS